MHRYVALDVRPDFLDNPLQKNVFRNKFGSVSTIIFLARVYNAARVSREGKEVGDVEATAEFLESGNRTLCHFLEAGYPCVAHVDIQHCFSLP